MSKGTAVAVVLLGFNNNFGNVFHTILIARLVGCRLEKWTMIWTVHWTVGLRRW